MDARCIRIKKFADTKISGYVWTGPENRVVFFDEVFFFLRVTQRLALRDEGKNGSGRRLLIRTVTSSQTVFRYFGGA